MAFYRQKDYAKQLIIRRSKTWHLASLVLLRRRQCRGLQDRSPQSTASLTFSITKLAEHNRNIYSHLRRVRNIGRISCHDVVENIPYRQWLIQFRICRNDMRPIVAVVGWPPEKTRTERSGYCTSARLTTLVLLHRMDSPCRWSELEMLFGKHASQLSELLWEGLERMLLVSGNLLTRNLPVAFIRDKAHNWANAIEGKCPAMDNCVGFIDGTVFEIARPDEDALQNSCYNGHKKRHSLEFQTVTAPDGLIIHAFGPLEGRRHDWTIYTLSSMDTYLSEVLTIDGVQYCVHGDRGYSRRVFLDVPFSGAILTAPQRRANTSTASVRVTVERMYKEVKLYWSSVDFTRKLNVGKVAVGCLYLGAMLLTNFRNSIYPNQVSQYFRCPPPTLPVYLSHRDVQE